MLSQIRTSQLTVSKLATLDVSSREADTDQLHALRDLLLCKDRHLYTLLEGRLDSIEKRITDPEMRTADTSDILVDAMRTSLNTDEQLGDTLKPVLIEQFHHTTRNDPEVMADALFPILGPAIRKMIAAMLTPDKHSKKRTYRLEQLFLIDKETGLPICNVAADTAFTQDADMVSGMLSAIQSFVHEAFSANDFDGLNTLQIGELSVWIEWGPSAILAAVIRGVAPEKLREAMQLQLENIHGGYSEALQQYEGDAQPFDKLKPELTTFLDNHDGTLKTKVKSLPPRIKKILGGTIVATMCLIGWMIFQSYDNYRWNKYVASVEAQPGIVVTKSQRRFRHYTIRGLRDPLAVDPLLLLKESSIDADHLDQYFEPFHAVHPAFVLDRLTTLLNPPQGVTLTVTGTTLTVKGGDAFFTAEALRLAPTVSGISYVAVLDQEG